MKEALSFLPQADQETDKEWDKSNGKRVTGISGEGGRPGCRLACSRQPGWEQERCSRGRDVKHPRDGIRETEMLKGDGGWGAVLEREEKGVGQRGSGGQGGARGLVEEPARSRTLSVTCRTFQKGRRAAQHDCLILAPPPPRLPPSLFCPKLPSSRHRGRIPSCGQGRAFP